MRRSKQYVVGDVAVTFLPAEETRVRGMASKLGLTVEQLIAGAIDKRFRAPIADELGAIERQIQKLAARAHKLREKRGAVWRDTAEVLDVVKRLAAPTKKRSAA